MAGIPQRLSRLLIHRRSTSLSVIFFLFCFLYLSLSNTFSVDLDPLYWWHPPSSKTSGKHRTRIQAGASDPGHEDRPHPIADASDFQRQEGDAKRATPGGPRGSKQKGGRPRRSVASDKGQFPSSLEIKVSFRFLGWGCLRSHREVIRRRTTFRKVLIGGAQEKVSRRCVLTTTPRCSTISAQKSPDIRNNFRRQTLVPNFAKGSDAKRTTPRGRRQEGDARRATKRGRRRTQISNTVVDRPTGGARHFQADVSRGVGGRFKSQRRWQRGQHGLTLRGGPTGRRDIRAAREPGSEISGRRSRMSRSCKPFPRVASRIPRGRREDAGRRDLEGLQPLRQIHQFRSTPPRRIGPHHDRDQEPDRGSLALGRRSLQPTKADAGGSSVAGIPQRLSRLLIHGRSTSLSVIFFLFCFLYLSLSNTFSVDLDPLYPFIFTMYGVNHVHHVLWKYDIYDIYCIFTINISRFFTMIIMVKIKSYVVLFFHHEEIMKTRQSLFLCTSQKRINCACSNNLKNCFWAQTDFLMTG